MGNKVALVNQSTASGIIIGPGATSVYITGLNISLDGDYVLTHGISPHDNASIISTNNSTVFIGGIKIIVNGDMATCGHSVFSSSTVSIG
jgi:uncharacterized Zn-binding protein involved in type VI secretion